MTNKLLKNKSRVLNQVFYKRRSKHYGYRTEQAYIAWINRFIFLQNIQHPDTMEKGNRIVSDLSGG